VRTRIATRSSSNITSLWGDDGDVEIGCCSRALGIRGTRRRHSNHLGILILTRSLQTSVPFREQAPLPIFNMHLSHVLPLFAGLAAALPTEVEPVVAREYLAAAPSGHEVQITGIAFAGSGCPANSVSGQLSTDLTTITLLYTSFVAESGPSQPSSNQRKNCQLNVKLKYPAGWQFSIFKADYRGYADIPKGDTGTCKATYYFSGDSKQASPPCPSAVDVHTANTEHRSARPSPSGAPTTTTTSRRTSSASRAPSGRPAASRDSSTSTPRFAWRLPTPRARHSSL